MGTLEAKIAIAVGAELLKRLFAPENKSQLTEKIVAAKTPDEVKAAVRYELAEIITESIELPAETEALIEELVLACSKEEVEAAIEKPSIQRLIIDGIVGLIQGIAALVFGKKE